MNNDLKTYDISRLNFILLGIAIILGGMTSIINFYLSHFLNKITAILWMLITILWIWHFHYLKNNITLATTNDKIIISQGPIRKILEIDLYQIEKIERKSPSKMIIWYQNKNGNIKKKRLYLSHIEGKAQIEFNKYIEKIIEKKISPAI